MRLFFEASPLLINKHKFCAEAWICLVNINVCLIFKISFWILIFLAMCLWFHFVNYCFLIGQLNCFLKRPWNNKKKIVQGIFFFGECKKSATGNFLRIHNKKFPVKTIFSKHPWHLKFDVYKKYQQIKFP